MGRNGQVAWHDILCLAKLRRPIVRNFSFILLAASPPLVAGIDISTGRRHSTSALSQTCIFPHGESWAILFSACVASVLCSGDVMLLLSAPTLKRKRRKKNILLQHTPQLNEVLSSLGLFLLETHFDAALVLKRSEWCAQAFIYSDASQPGSCGRREIEWNDAVNEHFFLCIFKICFHKICEPKPETIRICSKIKNS